MNVFQKFLIFVLETKMLSDHNILMAFCDKYKLILFQIHSFASLKAYHTA